MGLDVDAQTLDVLTPGRAAGRYVDLLVHRAIVLDIATNVDSTNLKNNVIWKSDSGQLGPTQAEIAIVEPDMQIEKTADVSFIADGTEVTFTLTVSHTAKSHTDAQDVVLTDVLPAGLDYVANTLNCTNGDQDPDPDPELKIILDTERPSLTAISVMILAI